MPGKLILKSINDLLGEQFIIPAYQRGYRWTDRQVNDLISDLWRFQRKKPNEFYCLQPIVVKKGDEQSGQWEVIDGQQRLTTIFIIIKCLAASLGIHTDEEYQNEFKNTLYSIEYKTRPGSKTFLENIINECDGDSNPDFFYMLNAYHTIRKWCEELTRGQKDKLLARIVGREDIENDDYAWCKVIWYEVDDQSDGPELFSRLNIGKIPLTNSELVKALFLSRSDDGHPETHQGEIALLWDEMEQQLHQEDFWAFITNEEGEHYPNRVELLFDILSEKHSSPDEYHTFLYFLDQLNKNDTESRWKLWRKIEDRYQTLREWYHDRDLYHHIGYLVNVEGKKIGPGELERLLEDSLTMEKHEFRDHIRERISHTLRKVGKNAKVPRSIGELEYTSDHGLISKLLLLFNVESVRQNIHSTERYPFKSSKAGKWSLEHIHAQASESLDATKSEIWEKWAHAHKNPLEELVADFEDKSSYDTTAEARLDEAKAILEKLNTFLHKPDAWTHAKFDEELFRPIIDIFTESDEDTGKEDSIHGIVNLALLKQDDNSAFSNSVFEVKRQKMLAADKKGSYIPVCTRRVFLKYYSNDISHSHVHFWGKNDRDAYLSEMKRVLEHYLSAQEGKKDES